jgi:hypothetical protein
MGENNSFGPQQLQYNTAIVEDPVEKHEARNCEPRFLIFLLCILIPIDTITQYIRKIKGFQKKICYHQPSFFL